MADQNPEDARTDQPSDVKARIDVENIADAADDSSAETAQKEQCDTMIASASANAAKETHDSTAQNESETLGILDLGTLPSPLDNVKTIKVDMPATRFLLDDLEKDATKLADSIAHVSGSLKINLHALTTMCGQYIDAHKLAVDSVGEVLFMAVDRSIASMSSLMVGCEQVTENMPPVVKLMEQLKEVKGTLAILESAVDASQ